MTIGFLLFELIPQVFFSLFNASDYMMSIGVPAFRIIGLSFPLAGFCISCGSVFQAMARGVYSMIVSICRQLVVLLPSAWLLSKTGVLNMVWWSYPIAEIASLALSIFFLRKLNREIISKIGSWEPQN